MLIIRHAIPNRAGNARTCIYDVDLDWLEKMVAPCMNGQWFTIENYFTLRVTADMHASKSQSDEILVDPDHKIEDGDISNMWLADYNAPFEGDIIFHKDNILYLRQIEGGIWTEFIPVQNKYGRTMASPCKEHIPGQSLFEWKYVFKTSHGGQGMRLKMSLGLDGKGIMQ